MTSKPKAAPMAEQSLKDYTNCVSGFSQKHVRFTPKSGHVQCKSLCLVWAKSGRRRLLYIVA